MAVTISEVARRAGVSTATVSRVVNGAVNVDAQLRGRVLAAMDELGYIPNTLAQSLRQNRSKTIGITTSDISVAFFPRVIRELESALQPQGYATLTMSTYDRPDREAKFLQQLVARKVDALIVCSTCQNEKMLCDIAKGGTPVILYDRRSRDFPLPAVYVDKRQSMTLALDHLCGMGHRRVMLVSGPRSLSTNYDRFMGFQRYAFDHDMDPDLFTFKFGEFSQEFGWQVMDEIFAAPERPTAVITGSVAITAGIMMYCKARGLRIPDDLALVSSGTFNYPSIVEPALTYLDDQDGIIAGELLKLLQSALGGQQLGGDDSCMIKPVLKLGTSSGCAAVSPD